MTWNKIDKKESNHTEISKNDANYAGISKNSSNWNKTEPEKGWFKTGWFTGGWFSERDKWLKVDKKEANYNKIEKV